MPTPKKINWFKSSYSPDGSQCVETSADLLDSGLVPVRDSKDPNSPVLTFTHEEFARFVTFAKKATV